MWYRPYHGFGHFREGIYRNWGRGVWAYRYKQHFFRSYWEDNPDLDHAGQYLANLIPRDPEEQEEWIRQIIRSIEDRLLWRAKQGIPTAQILDVDSSDLQDPIVFMQAIPAHEVSWLRPDGKEVTWTYVIDLEDRIFTINGYIHFLFSDMPDDCSQNIWAIRHLPSAICIYSPDTLEKYKTPQVRRWPNSSQAPETQYIDTYVYDSLLPIETPLREWGVRGWDELTPSEALSTYLVSTILLDQSSQIRNPDLDERRTFTYCQWQILTAAAPSAVTMSAWVSPRDPDFVDSDPMIHVALDLPPRFERPPEPRFPPADEWKAPRSIWFRGCLIMLCRRLDTLEFVKAEVCRLARALRSSRRSSALGLLFDGHLMVGVSLESTHIRHSPALRLYDSRMRLREGMLLLMHLLSPILTIDKTPWRASSLPRARASLPLPIELIVRITQLVDYDTYFNLQFVSHGFRSIYLTYPRLDNKIILGASFRALNTFVLFDTETEVQSNASLVRTYCGDPMTLSRSFYHRQRGLGMGFYTPGDLAQWHYECMELGKDPTECSERHPSTSIFRPTLWVLGQRRATISKDDSWWSAQDVKAQVVFGSWDFVTLSERVVNILPWSED